MADYSVIVQNLKCNGCVNSIITKIKALNFTTNVRVELENSSVHFSCDTENQFYVIKEILAQAGYPVAGEENPLACKAKSLVSCAIGRFSN